MSRSLTTRVDTTFHDIIVARWRHLQSSLNLQQDVSGEIWNVLNAYYSESHRHYHNWSHIDALCGLASKHAHLIKDKDAVALAIFFHDIIYDPKSKSNEEDSAELFLKLFSPHVEPALCSKVSEYILATKKHDVSASGDSDLQLFIDMDMSILGVSAEHYQAYARQIRQEYAFIPQADYCRGRAAMLESFLQNNHTSPPTDRYDGEGESVTGSLVPAKTIFATELFREEREAQARRNLAWETEILKSGRLV